MNELTSRVYAYCRDKGLIADGMKLIVGVSGGADSVCLLRMLKEMGEVISLDIIAVHIEHGIRGNESVRDMEFVRSLCEELNVPLRIYEEDVPARAGELSMTVEEAGRYIRYNAFEKELTDNGADAIAVAHHLNDQAETVLFNMARGSGIKGLSGIAPSRDRVIRPLLGVAREQIEEYLNDLGQSYCIDSTNSDTAYSRNGIRGVVIPELERIVTGAAGHIARAADELREAEEYIAEAADRVYKNAVPEGKLIIDVLKAEPRIIQKYVVRHMLSQIYSSLKDIEAVHVEDVIGLCDRQSGRSITLPGGVSARREGGTIVFLKRDGDAEGIGAQTGAGLCIGLIRDGITDVPGYGEFEARVEKYDKSADIPKGLYTKWFDYDKIINGVLIRKREGGDFITLDPDGKRKKLKKYLIDEKIPLSERDALILLADGSHIIWIAGYRISSHYKVGDETERVLKVTFRPAKDKADMSIIK